MHSPRKLPVLLIVVVIAFSGSLMLARNKEKKKPATGALQMEESKRAVHALNRLTFGPRPGEAERVAAMGVDRWIEWQLKPAKIDDSALDARLAPLRSLKMDTRTMLEEFPPPPVIKAVAEGRLPMPSDARRRAIYEAQLDRYRDRMERKQQAGANQGAPTEEEQANADSSKTQANESRREQRRSAELRAASLLELPPGQRFQEIMRMRPDERRMLATSLPPQQRERLLNDLTSEQRETLMAMANPQLVIMSELSSAKLLRAAYSQRQLEEVMTDFWYNHFNVFIGKGADRYLVTAYERDVIRPHAMGKFKELLVATAKSPAMLFYLDNWMSVGPNSEFTRYGPQRRAQDRQPRPRVRMGVGCGVFGCWPRVAAGTTMPIGSGQRPRNPEGQQQNAKQKRSGLNENYARELMELHTLGVSGGYTQKDVTEVARVFTGWTLKEPRKGGDFDFNERMHEPGNKTVLGKEVKQHGEEEGLKVLDMLAHHPSTARFISNKLAQRFVSDDPPPALVDRMARTFLDSDGDIREVLRTMFRSPEFWAPNMYRAKVKTPLEFVVSAVRASSADVDNATPIVQTLNRMGMPLYGAQPPTGYSMKAETWVNSAALLNRMNFGLAFASGRMPGVKLNTEAALAPLVQPDRRRQQVSVETEVTPNDPQTALALLENALLAGDVSRQTHDTILKQLNDPQITGRALDNATRPANIALLAGLIFGSPEFQRR